MLSHANESIIATARWRRQASPERHLNGSRREQPFAAGSDRQGSGKMLPQNLTAETKMEEKRCCWPAKCWLGMIELYGARQNNGLQEDSSSWLPTVRLEARISTVQEATRKAIQQAKITSSRSKTSNASPRHC